ncbi:hypothetical protein [Streptomyces beihaiensis]|uniref:Uncharacterized protein n=1 Tax=Streptomyces beihaiensis TaxID=2984495 RepID=A0ABT3TR00_9ACTN|nr:hypothetical protein [Streptomyces beihaiensis]MCX3059465.1 hypothetical protein [Streptomyces beihaiensis]
MTMRATVTQPPRGVIELFGKGVAVVLAATANGVSAAPDRSAEAARHATAPRHYGTVGRIVAGPGTGRYVRIDRNGGAVGADAGADAGVFILVAPDPAMRVDRDAEWVQDWAAVEETFLRDGRRVDWDVDRG